MLSQTENALVFYSYVFRERRTLKLSWTRVEWVGAGGSSPLVYAICRRPGGLYLRGRRVGSMQALAHEASVRVQPDAAAIAAHAVRLERVSEEFDRLSPSGHQLTVRFTPGVRSNRTELNCSELS